MIMMLTDLFPNFFDMASFGTSSLFGELHNSLPCPLLHTPFTEIFSQVFIFTVLSPNWDYINKI